MAQALAGAVNNQQALGLSLGQPPVSGAPLLDTGALRVAPSYNNAKAGGVDVASYVNGSGVRVPSVGITITDPSQLQASDYELTTDPAGAPGTLPADAPARWPGAQHCRGRRGGRVAHRHRRPRAGGG